MNPLDADSLRRVGEGLGSFPAGVFEERGTGMKWYVKEAWSFRQAGNEVIAARLYREMGFDAPETRLTTEDDVASRWREGLPDWSDEDLLTAHPAVMEAFVPSAFLENWDVAGSDFDNVLLDPPEITEPVFIDFGGTLDTRALGDENPYEPGTIRAFSGYLDPDVNSEASYLFSDLTREEFERGKDRLRALPLDAMKSAVGSVFDPPRAEWLIETMCERRRTLLATDYEDVFS